MRERKDMGDVGDDMGLRYMDENAAERSAGGGMGIDKPGVRGVAAEEDNDVAYNDAYARRDGDRISIFRWK